MPVTTVCVEGGKAAKSNTYTIAKGVATSDGVWFVQQAGADLACTEIFEVLQIVGHYGEDLGDGVSMGMSSVRNGKSG